MAQFVELDVRQTPPRQWHIRMVLPKETVEAEVRLRGQRSKMNRPEPGFSTVPFTGNRAAYFTVFTYFGHYQQAARGEWRAQGSGTFTKSFAIPGVRGGLRRRLASTFRPVQVRAMKCCLTPTISPCFQ
jgi:hypothetical protein